MEKRYQVFVSSTFADLKDERQKVMQTLMKMDCIPAGMELFPATDEEQFEFIKRIIDDCDYYLLIIGGRYGSLTAQGISYTEQEYEYALECGLKVIALLHKNPDQISFDKSEQTPELRVRLQAFRDKAATGRVVEFWQSDEELPGIVALSLINTIKLFPAIGWVRADKVSTEELLSEINELRKANAELTKTISEAEPNIFSGNEEKDYLFIYSKLDQFQDINVLIKHRESEEEQAKEERKIVSINVGSLIPFLSASDVHEYQQSFVSALILEELYKNYDKETHLVSVTGVKNLADELKMYGFLTKKYIPLSSGDNSFPRNLTRGSRYRMIFSEKMERYRYWLNVNGKMPPHIEIIDKTIQ